MPDYLPVVLVLSGIAAVALLSRLYAAQKRAREALQRMQRIADHLPALVGYVDDQERYRFANRTYAEWFGPERGDIVGKQVNEVWDAARYAESAPRMRRALAGERVEFDRHVRSLAGERILHSAYVPDVGPKGRVAGFFILSHDRTDEDRAQRELDRALKRLDMALDASRVTVWETDLRTGETLLSEAWADLMERAPGETRTTMADLSALVHPEDLAHIQRESMAVVRGELPAYAVEHRVRADSGQWKWILSRGEVVERDPATGVALRMMGTNLDITERKGSEQRLETLANYDSLTGCANRNLFADRLRLAIARCKRGGGRAALMFLDVDKFKSINDSLGHDAGDAVLKEFAARLRSQVRSTDTVGRLGGDEFAIVLEDVTEAAAPERVGQKILEVMRVPMDAAGHPVIVTTSIGIASFGGDAECDSLAKRADVALYEAKAAGRNAYRSAA